MGHCQNFKTKYHEIQLVNINEEVNSFSEKEKIYVINCLRKAGIIIRPKILKYSNYLKLCALIPGYFSKEDKEENTYRRYIVHGFSQQQLKQVVRGERKELSSTQIKPMLKQELPPERLNDLTLPPKVSDFTLLNRMGMAQKNGLPAQDFTQPPSEVKLQKADDVRGALVPSKL